MLQLRQLTQGRQYRPESDESELDKSLELDFASVLGTGFGADFR